ncbi:MAG: hypothetical protein K6G53_03115 [Bacteroidales bacterium]|nr:hypothetical protein [Bacteroidales bacterium]
MKRVFCFFLPVAGILSSCLSDALDLDDQSNSKTTYVSEYTKDDEGDDISQTTFDRTITITFSTSGSATVTGDANYEMTVGSDNYVFKTTASGGNGIVVSGSSKPSLKSGVSVAGGTTIFEGMGVTGATVSGGSSVSLSSYSGGTGIGGGIGPGGW